MIQEKPQDNSRVCGEGTCACSSGSSSKRPESLHGRRGGWPLGLERLTIRLRAMETSQAVATTPNSIHMQSESFSSYASSQLDTESTISFFQDHSITLGSLIGINPGDGNLCFAKSIFPEVMESDPTVTLTPGSMEQHETMISCCVCVPLVSTILAGRATSRC